MKFLVVDSNALRSPLLDRYLGSSISSKIVLSDLTIIEMRKKNAIGTSRESLRIVSKYPGQIFLMRPTHEIVDIDVSDTHATDSLFDYPGSVDLSNLGVLLQQLPVSPKTVALLADFQATAASQHQALLAEVADLEIGMLEVCREFTSQELSEFRTGKLVSESTKRKILDLLKITVAEFIKKNWIIIPNSNTKIASVKNTFSFRYSLCMMIYYIKWVRSGKQKLINGKTRANDVVDMQTAAIGSFFNGVLSGDKNLQDVSGSVRSLLRSWNSFVGDDWP